MIKIHSELCKGCGECDAVCHESCMEVVNKKITIDKGSCSTCGQCIAICPEQALWWDDNKPEAFNPALSVDKSHMAELLMERRTNRHLSPNKPPKLLLEEIINMGAYAPTHAFNMRCVTIDDEAIIDLIDSELFQSTKKIYNMFFKPAIIRWMLNFMPTVLKNEYYKAKPKLEYSVKMKRAYIQRPPAIIYVVGNRSAPLAVESAQYALYNMDLYARTCGLACRNLTGNNMFINKSSKVRKALGLIKNEDIFAALAIGYPAKKFRNKVMGRKFSIAWNPGR